MVFFSRSVSGLTRSAFYRQVDNPPQRDREVIQALNDLLVRHPRWGFWKCFKFLRKEHSWNHKRVYRVYCQLGLNQKKRTKKRLSKRVKRSLAYPLLPNFIWSADFMSDSLYGGKRFRTFNVIDDFNRELLHVEIDTSITGKRLVRVFEKLYQERGLPDRKSVV